MFTSWLADTDFCELRQLLGELRVSLLRRLHKIKILADSKIPRFHNLMNKVPL